MLASECTSTAVDNTPTSSQQRRCISKRTLLAVATSAAISAILMKKKNVTDLDNLPKGKSLIGVPFSISVKRGEGDDEHFEEVEVEFIDCLTIKLNGEIHSIEGLKVSEDDLDRNDKIPYLGTRVERFITDITPDEAGGLRLHSEYGHVHVTKESFAGMLAGLLKEKEDSSSTRSISIGFSLHPNENADLVINGATFLSLGNFKLPDRCTLHVRHVVEDTEKENATIVAQTENSDRAIQAERDRLAQTLRAQYRE